MPESPSPARHDQAKTPAAAPSLRPVEVPADQVPADRLRVERSQQADHPAVDRLVSDPIPQPCPADTAILIPAYKPDEALIGVLEQLEAAGADRILVVDDGSGEDYQAVFAEARTIGAVEVLVHAVNLGKGRALKTGLNHIYACHPDVAGVVTADADGQHAVADIIRVAHRMTESARTLVLGSRKISKDIPFRSYFGNSLTRWVFMCLIGKKISDTQTGLRGIPRGLVPSFLRLDGEGYEYELNMLIATKKDSIEIEEEEIETIYLEGNKSSHFNPLTDSMRIYFLLIRFLFSSLLATGIDFVVFWLAMSAGATLGASFLVGRIISGTINFAVNRSLVFHNRGSVWTGFFKYYTSLFVMLGVSYGLTKGLISQLSWGAVPAKALVETLLFFVGFVVQRDIIFYNRADDAREDALSHDAR